MKKMKRYNGEEESEVSYVDEDSPESQKVYSSKLTELSDEERMPRRAASSPAPKKAAPKAAAKPAAKAEDDTSAYFGRARPRAAPVAKSSTRLSDLYNRPRTYATPAEENRARKVAEAKQSQGMKKGGSVASASRRADGIAQRGKTRGKLV